MFTEELLDKSSTMRKKWEDAVKRTVAKHADQKEKWTTVSDLEIKRLYGPEDIKDMDFEKDIGYPGQYPYLRGNQVTGYRGKYWTFRMFSGMGSAEETNQRWHYLLQSGQSGLSTEFDFPTLMGYDTDSPKARGECGKCGVAIDTIEDFFTLIKGIPLGEITTSMTINPPATVLWAMYCAAAEMQGIPLTKIGGTIQNDMLKEFIAQKTLMCPPEPSVKLISDTVEFGTKYVPRWNTISISGYHIREAGSTAVQELAFTLRDGMEYVEDVLERKGLHVDQFAPRLSFFFNAHIDFFEEIAKLRAARRIWAKAMRERYGSQDERSWWMRFHTRPPDVHLLPSSLITTSSELPLRLWLRFWAAPSPCILFSDEVLCLPSDHAVQIALRTQQIIAEETGVVNTIDPLAGSYFVEALTNKMEEQAWEYIHKIDDMGGMVKAIEKGFPQMEISDAAYKFQRQIDSGEKIMIGINKYVTEEDVEIPFLEIDDTVEKEQIERLNAVRRNRDSRKVRECLDDIRNACKKGENVMPYCIEAVKNYCSVQEICDVYREVYGPDLECTRIV